LIAGDASMTADAQAFSGCTERDRVDKSMAEAMTTLMVRNVPAWYTQDMLLKEWPNEGIYDMLYLPFKFKTRQNMGFAFVNFTDPCHAEAFRLRWHKTHLSNHSAKKPLDISFADLQGRFRTLEKLTKHKNCRIKNVYFQPAIWVNQERITMEAYLDLVRGAAAVMASENVR